MYCYHFFHLLYKSEQRYTISLSPIICDQLVPRLAIRDLIGEVLTSSPGRTCDAIPVTRERWRSARSQSVCFGSDFGEVRTFCYLPLDTSRFSAVP